MKRLLCLGEILIDFVSEDPGSGLEEVRSFRKAPGGAPANVAVGYSRLGGRAGFIGKAGDDAFGRFLEKTLRSEGVDTRGLTFTGGARTTLAFVHLSETGERDFLFYRHPGADLLLGPADVEEALIEGYDAIHFGSLSLTGPGPAEATLKAVRAVRARGGKVSFDPNIRLPLWPSPREARETVLGVLGEVHILKVSLEEAVFLSGQGGVEEAGRSLLGAGPALVLVSAGASGAYFFSKGASGHVPGFTVRTVDTTGAGDAFTAAALLGLLDLEEPGREGLEWALAFANAAGALCTTVKGAIPGLPRAAEVRSLLRGRRET